VLRDNIALRNQLKGARDEAALLRAELDKALRDNRAVKIRFSNRMVQAQADVQRKEAAWSRERHKLVTALTQLNSLLQVRLAL
jgi:hypothetical protein